MGIQGALFLADTWYNSQGIPQKGDLLTRLSKFWFLFLNRQIPSLRTHYISTGVPSSLSSSLPSPLVAQLENRTLCVKRLKIFPLESIVRGYISGSAWASYKKDGTMNSVKLPIGLKESEKLPKPVWTPSTKVWPLQAATGICLIIDARQSKVNTMKT